jgi:hypothetical protein
VAQPATTTAMTTQLPSLRRTLPPWGRLHAPWQATVPASHS